MSDDFLTSLLKISDIPFNLKDKFFEITFYSNESVDKITSYFPLSEQERLMIISISKQPTFSNFHSIFTDIVTDDQWNKTKDQIKKRFQNELFDIDHKL